MTTPEQTRLIEGYRRFRKGGYKQAAELYRELGEGQDPDIMIIACADSRADPALIFDAAPGEFFIIRNVAALVPPYDEDSNGLHGVSAAVEFAVEHLKVKTILVMGHAACGGVKASLSAADERPVGQFIAPWVEISAPAREKVLADKSIAPDQRQQALEWRTIEQSIVNLETFPFIQSAIKAGQLSLEGTWFSIADGVLYHRQSDGAFKLVEADD